MVSCYSLLLSPASTRCNSASKQDLKPGTNDLQLSVSAHTGMFGNKINLPYSITCMEQDYNSYYKIV